MKFYRGVITELKPNQVFVFGSNLAGFHGAGAAGYASFGEFGNVWRQHDYGNKPNGWIGKWNVKGISAGLQHGREGMSYALPTVITPGQLSLSINEIKANVRKLYSVARTRNDLEFLVAYKRIAGKSLNGYNSYEMASTFVCDNIPENMVFEVAFYGLIESALRDAK